MRKILLVPLAVLLPLVELAFWVGLAIVAFAAPAYVLVWLIEGSMP
jgi:hypothetical protein